MCASCRILRRIDSPDDYKTIRKQISRGLRNSRDIGTYVRQIRRLRVLFNWLSGFGIHYCMIYTHIGSGEELTSTRSPFRDA